jgi:hypothetical protein
LSALAVFVAGTDWGWLDRDFLAAGVLMPSLDTRSA